MLKRTAIWSFGGVISIKHMIPCTQYTTRDEIIAKGIQILLEQAKDPCPALKKRIKDKRNWSVPSLEEVK